jgi:hypothetical protein
MEMPHHHHSMNPIVIPIAGRDYNVKPLTIRKSREWRESFEHKFDGLVTVLTTFSTIEVNNLSGVGEVIATLKSTLINSVDTVLDLVCAYAPEIDQDRERIENEAYDAEIVEAFGSILGLVFPLGKLTRVVNGLTGSTISKS